MSTAVHPKHADDEQIAVGIVIGCGVAIIAISLFIIGIGLVGAVGQGLYDRIRRD